MSCNFCFAIYLKKLGESGSWVSNYMKRSPPGSVFKPQLQKPLNHIHTKKYMFIDNLILGLFELATKHLLAFFFFYFGETPYSDVIVPPKMHELHTLKSAFWLILISLNALNHTKRLLSISKYFLYCLNWIFWGHNFWVIFGLFSMRYTSWKFAILRKIKF